MTRKDYTAIANILAWVHDTSMKGRVHPDDVVPMIAEMFAEYAQKENPQFNPTKFNDAVGITWSNV
jgi:hypothetical protein